MRVVSPIVKRLGKPYRVACALCGPRTASTRLWTPRRSERCDRHAHWHREYTRRRRRESLAGYRRRPDRPSRPRRGDPWQCNRITSVPIQAVVPKSNTTGGHAHYCALSERGMVRTSQLGSSILRRWIGVRWLASVARGVANEIRYSSREDFPFEGASENCADSSAVQSTSGPTPSEAT